MTYKNIDIFYFLFEYYFILIIIFQILSIKLNFRKKNLLPFIIY